MRILFICILITQFASGHVDLFNLNQGKFFTNNDFKGNFSYNLDFTSSTKSYYLKEIGLCYFNVGDDDSSNINLKIYKSTNLKEPVVNIDTVFTAIYNQTAFIKTVFFFKGGFEYTIVINSKNLQNDDKINLFQPQQIPFYNTELNCKIQKINASFENIPSIPTDKCPFLSFGINDQNGINVISELVFKKYNSIPSNKKYTTVFQCRNNITPIGYQISYMILGLNKYAHLGFEIKDNEENSIIKIDTVFSDTTKFFFQIHFKANLYKNYTYTLSLEILDQNDDDNIFLLYKPFTIPYLENTENIYIKNFKINDIEDSTGLIFNLMLDLDELGKQAKIEELKDIKIVENNDNILVNGVFSTDDIQLYSIIGERKSIHSTINEIGINISKENLTSGNYILFSSKNYFLPKLFQIHK